MAPRAIFRDRALEAYRRGREKDIVPRLASRSIIMCAWVLLGVLLGAVAIAFSVRIPTYVDASGLIVASDEFPAPRGSAAAVLFIPPDQSTELRVGRPVHMQVGSSGSSAQGSIAKVESTPISPDAARERYRVDVGSNLVTQPSVVAVVRIPQMLPSATYAGSHISARVDTGSQRLLTLLPKLGGVG